MVTIETQVRDPAAIGLACGRQLLPEPEFGTAMLFLATVTGWKVRLPESQYPVVCDVELGQLQYDNDSGRWGE